MTGTTTPPCTCGHEFSQTGMFHLGDCPRKALPAIEEGELVEHVTPDPARVILGGFMSKCSRCGGNASPYEDSHIHGGPKSGYATGSTLDDTNGCGVTYDLEPLDPYVHPTFAEIGSPKEPTP